jgi:hypothetical protein
MIIPWGGHPVKAASAAMAGRGQDAREPRPLAKPARDGSDLPVRVSRKMVARLMAAFLWMTRIVNPPSRLYRMPGSLPKRREAGVLHLLG